MLELNGWHARIHFVKTPSHGNAVTQMICENTCSNLLGTNLNGNGACNDNGLSSGGCEWGHDCADCGPRDAGSPYWYWDVNSAYPPPPAPSFVAEDTEIEYGATLRLWNGLEASVYGRILGYRDYHGFFEVRHLGGWSPGGLLSRLRTPEINGTLTVSPEAVHFVMSADFPQPLELRERCVLECLQVV